MLNTPTAGVLVPSEQEKLNASLFDSLSSTG